MFDADSKQLDESDNEDSGSHFGGRSGGRTQATIVVGKDDEARETDDSVRPGRRAQQQHGGRWDMSYWLPRGSSSSMSVTSDVTDDGTVGSFQAACAGLRRTLNTYRIVWKAEPTVKTDKTVAVATAWAMALVCKETVLSISLLIYIFHLNRLHDA